MVDPASLSAGAIAVLIATKAFERTGEQLSESTWQLVRKLLNLLKQKSPSTATAIERVAQNPELVEQKPNSYSITVLARQVEQTAAGDTEIQSALQEISNAIKSKPETITNISKLAEKIGFLVQGGENDFKNSTFNF